MKRIFCPLCLHEKNPMVCIYTCAISTKRKCAEYARVYEEIRVMVIEQRYLDKYGIPEFPEPYALVRQRRIAAAAKKAEAAAERQQRKIEKAKNQKKKEALKKKRASKKQKTKRKVTEK